MIKFSYQDKASDNEVKKSTIICNLSSFTISYNQYLAANIQTTEGVELIIINPEIIQTIRAIICMKYDLQI